MRDLDRFIELYKSFGIELKPEKTAKGFKIELSGSAVDYNGKLDGYSMFFSDVEFDKDGKFLRQGFWE